MIDEFLQAYRHQRRKARKDHRCCECHGLIRRGEFSHYHSGFLEGSARSYRHCEDCEQLFSELNDKVADIYDGIPFEGLSEAVLEESPATVIRFVAIKAKRGARIPNWMLERVGL